MGETTLEKNKDYIEFSMRSMMITHKPYDGDAEIGVTGTIPERDFFNVTNPFDIPGDVVMVYKRYFERLQVENDRLRTVSEELKKKLTTIQTAYALNEFDPIPEFKELLKKLYSTDDAENLEWVLNHTCGGRGSVNGWIAVSLFWKQKYETLSKLVGFSSVEEVQEYLTNNVECDTLQEAISKLRDEVTYTCEKLADANSENNSWKATAECNSPKELMTKLKLLRDTIEHWRDRTIDIGNLCADYRNQIKAWKEVTGCDTPEDAKDYWTAKLSESGEVSESLAREVRSWKNATGCSTPEEANKKLASYEGRLDSVKQSASIAIRHLDNIVFRDDKRTDWSDK